LQEINQQLIKENKALFEETKIIAQLKQKSNSLAAQNEDTQKNEPIKDDLLTKSVKTQEIFDQKIKTIENEYATNIEKLNKEVDELKYFIKH